MHVANCYVTNVKIYLNIVGTRAERPLTPVKSLAGVLHPIFPKAFGENIRMNGRKRQGWINDALVRVFQLLFQSVASEEVNEAYVVAESAVNHMQLVPVVRQQAAVLAHRLFHCHRVTMTSQRMSCHANGRRIQTSCLSLIFGTWTKTIMTRTGTSAA